MKATDLAAQRLILDPAVGADLRVRLRQDPQAGAKQAAQQFEGMLLHLMLKSMRDATSAGGLLDSEQSRFFTAIGDQQMAQDLAAKLPLGFAGLVEKQLARQMPAAAATTTAITSDAPLDTLQQSLLAQYANRFPVVDRRLPGVQRPTSLSTVEGGKDSAGVPRGREFIDRVWPHAVEASARTGIPAHFLIAQSALESGWGRRELRTAEGSPSHNVFGIKAGRNWSGPTVEVQTTEFVNGVAQAVRAKFRVYGSYAEAFHDYAQLLTSNPRFSGAIGQQDGVQFARSLQQAGYATDPMYADKLARIIGGTTLRQALSAA